MAPSGVIKHRRYPSIVSDLLCFKFKERARQKKSLQNGREDSTRGIDPPGALRDIDKFSSLIMGPIAPKGWDSHRERNHNNKKRLRYPRPCHVSPNGIYTGCAHDAGGLRRLAKYLAKYRPCSTAQHGTELNKESVRSRPPDTTTWCRQRGGREGSNVGRCRKYKNIKI